ncbi:hypothetical protein GW17_00014812 [Ensete ventricosum]|nr:hypothetical protein GW17_00014812 [Ensete ventricosum]
MGRRSVSPRVEKTGEKNPRAAMVLEQHGRQRLAGDPRAKSSLGRCEVLLLLFFFFFSSSSSFLFLPQSTVDGRFLLKSTADGGNRPSTTEIDRRWRKSTIDDGNRPSTADPSATAR